MTERAILLIANGSPSYGYDALIRHFQDAEVFQGSPHDRRRIPRTARDLSDILRTRELDDVDPMGHRIVLGDPFDRFETLAFEANRVWRQEMHYLELLAEAAARGHPPPSLEILTGIVARVQLATENLSRAATAVRFANPDRVDPNTPPLNETADERWLRENPVTPFADRDYDPDVGSDERRVKRRVSFAPTPPGGPFSGVD